MPGLHRKLRLKSRRAVVCRGPRLGAFIGPARSSLNVRAVYLWGESPGSSGASPHQRREPRPTKEGSLAPPTDERELIPTGLLVRLTPKESPEYRVQGEPAGAETEDDQRSQEKGEFGGADKFVRMTPDI
jgi:hypothetical protein